MKGIRTILLLVIVSAVGFACGPKRIPDDKMTDIMFDMLVMNAYVSNMPNKIQTDTVDIYEPLLASYGYDFEDFQYTLNKMALKKSSRLSELLRSATHRLQAEDRYFTTRERIWKQIDSVAIALYTDTIFRIDDRVIRFNSADRQDSVKFTFPAQAGVYRFTYHYMIDSLDENSYYNARWNFRDLMDRSVAPGSRVLIKRKASLMDVELDALSNYRTLELNLANPSNLRNKPYVTIDSFYVMYHEPIEVLRERLTRHYLGFDSENHLPYEPTEEDSVALRTVPPLRLDSVRVAEF